MKTNKLDRRDFLKLAGLLPFSIATPNLANLPPLPQQAGNPHNVIIVVFDAFSANNISLYGYQRETTPNLARLAERAVVYHNHYSGGNFTTPGTASLLTGVLPWTHRAFHHRERVEKSFVHRNIFSAFQDYHRIVYSHNPLVDVYYEQFREYISDWIPRDRLFLRNDVIIPKFFKQDEDIASVSWVRSIKNKEDEFAYSLFLSHLYEIYQEEKIKDFRPQFPLGLPNIAGDNYYILEDATDWLVENTQNFPQPFLGYFHFLPPHAPYATHKDFYGRFASDGWTPAHKHPDLFFSDVNYKEEQDLKKRKNYDEFILYVDSEFGRLFEYLDASGLSENTWIVLTSDHGEMFERGITGHKTPVLYEPVIRIPLMIFEPGRKTRSDVHMPTSAVDLLPTLLHVTGHEQPDWSEGIVLPPFSDSNLDTDRNIYVSESKKNKKNAPLSVATVTLIKGQYKLMYFYGYDELRGEERIELYDLERDPEEMSDLYVANSETAKELLYELKTKLAEVNEPYQ